MARVVWMLTMNAATSAGFDIDRIDDVALAVTEAFGAVSRADPGGAVSYAVRIGDDGVHVDIVSDAAAVRPFSIDALARGVLESITEELTVGTDRAAISFRIAPATT
jgi:hypothetical protein